MAPSSPSIIALLSAVLLAVLLSVPAVLGGTVTGNIEVIDAGTGASYGYAAVAASGGYTTVTTIDQASLFSYDSSASAPYSITIVSPSFDPSSGNLFGGNANNQIIQPGNDYAFSFSAVAYAPPQSTGAESSIWSVDPTTSALSAVWTNPSSPVQDEPQFAYDSAFGYVGITGDFSLYVSTSPQLGPVLVNLFFTLPGGAISGDPHFVGLQGEKYNIVGENNKWFNLITAKDFQMNALFQAVCDGKDKLTAMTSLAINMQGSRLLLNVTGAQLDGAELIPAPRNRPYLAGPKINPGAYGKIVHPWENYFEVQTSEFSLKIVRKVVDHSIQKEGMVYFGENCLDGYFNIQMSDKNISAPLHGLLGQTAHHSHSSLVENKDPEGKGEIEGSYKDYIVGGPFEGNFKFNLFKAN